MFDYSSLISDGLKNPDELWWALDSFWRERTTIDTADFAKYVTYANLLMLLNGTSKADHFVSTHSVPNMGSFAKLPWWPIVIFKDQLTDQSFVLYGQGYLYNTPEEIVYGQAGDPAWLYPVPFKVAGVPELVDSVTKTTVVIDRTSMSFSADTQKITFNVDPFTLVTPKTLSDTGREYIVLWARNLELDLTTNFDQVGWVVKYGGASSDVYNRSLKVLWEATIKGASLRMFKAGTMAAAGFSYATKAGTVRDVIDDGFLKHVITDDSVYSFSNTLSAVVVPGDTLVDGSPVSDGVKFFEYDNLMSATEAQVPGLALSVPLSTGTVAHLAFANRAMNWSYDAGRPSPWRFPIAGAPADVEQFWVDVDTYATANSIDLETLFSLPAAVNPMQLVVGQLLKNNVFVASADMADLPANIAGFTDRVRKLLSPSAIVIVNQNLPGQSDVVDLSLSASEDLGYGYNAAVPTEVVSYTGGGTDLTYFDRTPLVVCY